MMLQEHDFNMNMTSKQRRECSIREETQSMSFIKQRKIAQQMKFARQNHEDCSDIYKLQNWWKDIRQQHQWYCEKAMHLNCSSLSSLLITLKKLRSASIQSLILHHYDLCINCNVSRVLSNFFFRDLIDSLILCVYCINKLNLSEDEMHWYLSYNHNVLCSIFWHINDLKSNQCIICRLVFFNLASSAHIALNQNLDASIMSENDWNLLESCLEQVIEIQVNEE